MKKKPSTKAKRANQLSLINEAISYRGVAFMRNGLLIEKEQPIETLNEIAASVVEIGGGVQWWLGDIGIAMQGSKGEKYTAGRAEILGIDPGYWMVCVLVSRFYPVLRRHKTLSHSHHVSAIKGAGGVKGDVATALAWLDKAHAAGWSVSELRKAIANDQATSGAPDTEPEEDAFAPLWQADQWATSHREDLAKIEPARAAKMLVGLQSLASVIDGLRARAALETPSNSATQS